MRRMARITGRSDDMLIVRGVNVLPSQIEELLFRCSGLAPQYEIELTRDGHLDALAVHVEQLAEVERSRGEEAARELASLVGPQREQSKERHRSRADRAGVVIMTASKGALNQFRSIQ
jgi:phenylacetate-coenzyme A ligase PaaK-like adenylate-forming protein